MENMLYSLILSCGNCAAPVAHFNNLSREVLIKKYDTTVIGVNQNKFKCPKNPTHHGMQFKIIDRDGKQVYIDNIKKGNAPGKNDDTIQT